MTSGSGMTDDELLGAFCAYLALCAIDGPLRALKACPIPRWRALWAALAPHCSAPPDCERVVDVAHQLRELGRFGKLGPGMRQRLGMAA